MSIEEKVEALIRRRVEEKVRQADRKLRGAIDEMLPFGVPFPEAEALIERLRPIWEKRFRDEVEHDVARNLLGPPGITP